MNIVVRPEELVLCVINRGDYSASAYGECEGCGETGVSVDNPHNVVDCLRSLREQIEAMKPRGRSLK